MLLGRSTLKSIDNYRNYHSKNDYRYNKHRVFVEISAQIPVKWQKSKKRAILCGMDWKAWIQSVKAWAGRWPGEAAPYFVAQWGLNPEFAAKVAVLYLCLYAAGLNPRINSGFRDPEKQKQLIAKWDALKREGKDPLKHGFIGKPASPDGSRHCRMQFGKPSSTAIDMPCSDNNKAALIAKALGLRAGVDFNDPGHYDMG